MAVGAGLMLTHLPVRRTHGWMLLTQTHRAHFLQSSVCVLSEANEQRHSDGKNKQVILKMCLRHLSKLPLSHTVLVFCLNVFVCVEYKLL